MIYIKLNDDTINELKEIIKTESRYKSRNRAHALLLSNEGKSTTEIAKIFNCSQRTVYRWFERFKDTKIDALHDLPGRGRKPLLVQKEHAEPILRNIKKN